MIYTHLVDKTKWGALEDRKARVQGDLEQDIYNGLQLIVVTHTFPLEWCWDNIVVAVKLYFYDDEKENKTVEKHSYIFLYDLDYFCHPNI